MKKALSEFHGAILDTPETRKKGYRYIHDPKYGRIITAKKGSQAEVEIKEDIDLLFSMAESLGK